MNLDKDHVSRGSQEQADRPSFVAAPSIAMPKGGGAIRGIGEKFAANPATGAGTTSIPLAMSPGRSGFAPQLTLSYDSATGNGPFGFGWSLSIPSIARKTDKGLPRYIDSGDDADVFILSGAEDLVPTLVRQGGQWTREHVDPRTRGGHTYAIVRYRPRTETAFARIEYWANVADASDSFWRSITRDNVTTWYGRSADSRIVRPQDPSRIFSWLICESHDDKGNAILYSYAAENAAGVDVTQASERNRDVSAARYLKRIRYGNRRSYLLDPDLANADWMFDVVFDYDEGHYEPLPLDVALREDEQHRRVRATAVLPDSDRWRVRPDPFSVYRSRFEVRTYRRCRRVLMFHTFEELGPEPQLVRATEFDYRDFDYSGLDPEQPSAADAERAHHGSTRVASFIQSVTQSGLVRDEERGAVVRDGATYLTYIAKAMPPVEFEYTRPIVSDQVHEVEAESLDGAPSGVDGSAYQFVDLDGEGLAGILTQQAGAWHYKHALGEGRFGPAAVIASPSTAALGAGDQLLDLAGDGQLDLVVFAGSTPGFFERTNERDWAPFRSFTSLPNLGWNDPNLRFIDLNGDGHADILVTEQDAWIWYPSLGEDGFAAACRLPRPATERDAPQLVFGDSAQAIYVADMCGHGLPDLVRVGNGAVCYWPNVGYGQFGATVTMDDAPWFDDEGQFDARRVRLADIDGSGTNDLIYLGRDGVRLYFNQSGNRWSGACRLTAFPGVDNSASVATADLLGNGTACLVWSSALPGDLRRPLRYVDLMGGTKPHLLVRAINNLGAETVVRYVASTQFYLDDKNEGRPWTTRLPFPVHVVDRVETFDHIGRSRFVTRYAYHDGFFDGVEREFRGFGMVEQWDTESFAAFVDGAPLDAANVDAASHVPPVHTKTWFHTGTIDGTPLPGGLSLDEEREGARALRGSMLRQEVYARDGSARADHPYTVVEHSYTVVCLQPQGGNRHAVFLSHPRETLTSSYERDLADPRMAHSLTLEVDRFGNVCKQATVAYGRRGRDTALTLDGDLARQTRPLLTYSEADFTPALLHEPDDYRAPQPAEMRTYELTGYNPSGEAGRYAARDFVRPDAADPDGLRRQLIVEREIAYEEQPSGGNERRQIEVVRTLYRKNDLTGFLPLRAAESQALPGETYTLAFTRGLLDAVFQRPLDRIRPPGAPPPEALLPDVAGVLGLSGPDGGGYVDLDGDGRWWVPSGRVCYSGGGDDSAAMELTFARQHFFVARRYRDPFGATTTVGYDASRPAPAGDDAMRWAIE